MAFKMKGHSIPGIKGFKGDKLKDGRHGSSPFQQGAILPEERNWEDPDKRREGPPGTREEIAAKKREGLRWNGTQWVGTGAKTEPSIEERQFPPNRLPGGWDMERDRIDFTPPDPDKFKDYLEYRKTDRQSPMKQKKGKTLAKGGGKKFLDAAARQVGAEIGGRPAATERKEGKGSPVKLGLKKAYRPSDTFKKIAKGAGKIARGKFKKLKDAGKHFIKHEKGSPAKQKYPDNPKSPPKDPMLSKEMKQKQADALTKESKKLPNKGLGSKKGKAKLVQAKQLLKGK